jgi:pimeloyl-ACP methyl ester carboxylesterase
MSPPDGFEARELDLHGHRVVYRIAGEGPPVLLIHGMINSSRHWREVAMRLAESHTVVAPDLIGHGDSATPRGDYSIGAHAASIRDLLAAIGIESTTVIGHSLGGGIAMQFFYQFPPRTERLALISSGGLGPEVSPLLRVAALPGAATLLRAAANKRVVETLDSRGTAMRERGNSKGVYLQAIARALRPLQDSGSRQAFLQTLRSVIDVRGQRVSALDRLYLLRDVPMLVVWGERDRTIPLAHGRHTAAAIPHARFETLPKAAHFPHLDDPDGLATILADFLETTEAAPIADADWGEVVRARDPARVTPVR